MDVLYVVGEDHFEQYSDLKWSLRGLDKFAQNLNRVLIVGYIPKWVSKEVICIPYLSNHRLPKQSRILDAILYVIDNGYVHNEFLYSSDDHFLIKPVNFDNFPYYYKRERMYSFEDIFKKKGIHSWKGYYRSITDTRSLLEREGYGIKMWNGHVNTHLDTRDAQEVKRLISSASKAINGYEPTCLFMNIRQSRAPVKPTYRKDIKFDRFPSLKEFNEKYSFYDTFSTSDTMTNKQEFNTFMQNIFPWKSIYEV